MFWNNKKIPYIKSLRLRSALLAAVLFLLFSVLSFLALFYLYSSYSYNAADGELTSAVEKILCLYLTGQKMDRLGRNIYAEELPLNVIQATGSLHKDFQPLFYFFSQNRKDQFYSVVGGAGKKYFLVTADPSGRIISSRSLNPDRNIPELQKRYANWMQYTEKGVFFRLANEKGGTLAGADSPRALEAFRNKGKMYLVQKRILYNGRILECAVSLHGFHARQKRLFHVCSLIFVVLLPFGFLTGWGLASYVTRGLKNIRNAALKISAGDLAHRVKVEEPFAGDEVEDLVAAFNKMSASNELLVTELRSVTDDIAHDLRTPLTRIRGTAELAVLKCSSSGCREAYGSIAEECDCMISIIGDMLEISRSETGILKPEKKPFSLTELLEKLFDVYKMTAEELGQKWSIKLPEKEIIIEADKLKLQRVFSNLMDNGAKFMSEGDLLTLSVEEKSENGVPSSVIIRIADTGPGIPDNCKEKVFKRFFRVDSSRSTTGNGLGLALVAAVIHSHNGTIHVEDTIGGGATFVMELPLK